MEVDSELHSTHSSDSEKPQSSKTTKAKGGKKESKPGIIYLSVIPPKMNVSQIREYFSQFGEIHRSFLQPDEKSKQRSKKNQVFTEGWIEFKKKRHAKRVATMLNNTPLGGKKKKQNYDFLWNIKYLPGLLWVHINERLAYERISRQQKMRAEIAAAKRETSYFAKSVGLNRKLKKARKAEEAESEERDVEIHESGTSGGASTASESVNPTKAQPKKEISANRLQLLQMLMKPAADLE